VNRTVQAGYDELAPRFGEWMAQIKDDPWERFVEELERLSPRGSGGRLLDLGCGGGTKTKRLAERFEVVGVDISEEQLRLARAEVREATFLQADFTELDFAPETFDAVSAFYSIIHVPRAQHAALLRKIRGWLKPGAFFLGPFSHVGGPDRTEEWLGVQMFFSGFPAEKNRQLVREAGFEAVIEEIVRMQEPEQETAWLWVLARRPS
jgi:ubiquinone/menaquinone biosynthesis C-methylase UbiE